MLIPFTIAGGATVYVSGDHVEHVATSTAHDATAPTTAILLQDGTVITVTEDPLAVMTAVNGSLTVALVENSPPQSAVAAASRVPVPGRVAA